MKTTSQAPEISREGASSKDRGGSRKNAGFGDRPSASIRATSGPKSDPHAQDVCRAFRAVCHAAPGFWPRGS